jgi:tripartite motif-containing protein 71
MLTLAIMLALVANASGAASICTVAANCQSGSPGGLGGEFNVPHGVAVSPAGNVYVVDGASNPRVQQFDSQGGFLRAWGKDVSSAIPGTGAEICTAAASCKTGVPGGLDGEFDSPQAIAVDSSGDIYVTDNGRVQKFDSQGNFLSILAGFSSFGEGGSLSNFVYGVAVDAADNVYVSDTSNQRIQKFDSSGGFVSAWGKDVVDNNPGTGFEVCTVAATCKAGEAGSLGGEMRDPSGIAADSSGNVYVVDDDDFAGNGRVTKFDSQGNFQRAWGKDVNAAAPGTGPEICTAAADCQFAGNVVPGTLGGEFNLARGVFTDASGNVHVADAGWNRIQVFDPAGNFLAAHGRDVDAANPSSGVEVCTVAATCQAGTPGALGGEFINPEDGEAAGDGSIYIADAFNRRIQKLSSSFGFLLAWGNDVLAPPVTVLTPTVSNQFLLGPQRRLPNGGVSIVGIFPHTGDVEWGGAQLKSKERVLTPGNLVSGVGYRQTMNFVPLPGAKKKLTAGKKLRTTATITYRPRLRPDPPGTQTVQIPLKRKRPGGRRKR